jgi:membrane protease YdiL (CAAX protease family)
MTSNETPLQGRPGGENRTIERSNPRTPERVTALLVLLAIAGPAVFVLVSERLTGPSPSLAVSVALQILYCVLAAVLIITALRIEGASLASLGLRQPTWQTVALAAGIVFVAHVILPIVTTPLMNLFSSAAVLQEAQRLSTLPIWLRFFMAVTGGAIEETLYRGYATERLVRLTGRPWVAAALVVCGFGLAHIPAWGIAFALTVDLPFGLLMTIVYLWRRDLLANILAHSSGLILGLLAV